MDQPFANFTVPKSDQLNYNSYLKVGELTDLQRLISSPAEHDEMLFIVIHQVYELWFKQILHEIGFSRKALIDHQGLKFLRALNRINTIFDTLIKQVDILETMTPNDFNRFRNNLDPGSGFQSMQFRAVEFSLGSKEAGYLKFHKIDEKNLSYLKSLLSEASLYDLFLRYLNHLGHAIPKSVLGRDVSQAYTANDEVTAVLKKIYEHPESEYELYVICEKLMDLDQRFLQWRYRHVAMVERMIGGMGRGTGGSSGVKYLQATLEKRFFPELWDVRNKLNTLDKPYGGGKP